MISSNLPVRLSLKPATVSPVQILACRIGFIFSLSYDFFSILFFFRPNIIYPQFCDTFVNKILIHLTYRRIFRILSGSGVGWMDNFPGNEPQVPNFDIVNRVGWANLKAVQNNNVYEIAHAMSRSVFCFYACQKLAATFYPEEFADVDVDANIREFFERFMLTDSTVTGWFHRMTPEALTK